MVAVGGDGTVNEVVNGLLGAAMTPDPGGSEMASSGPETASGAVNSTSAVPVAGRPALGVIPAGSGNDFARALGIPLRDPAAATKALLDRPARAIDVGRVDVGRVDVGRVDVGRVGVGRLDVGQESGRYFVNGIGWGLDGRVAAEAGRRRRLGGRAMYVSALLSALRGHRPAHVDISVDGRTVPGYVTLIAVTNGPTFGGGFRICPHARLDDGQLDLCVGDAMGRLAILRLVPRVLRGTHLGHAKVWYARGAAITLTSREPLPLQADGEVIDAAATRVVVEIVASGLWVRGVEAPLDPRR